MKSTLLLIISLLAGCGLMPTDTAPAIAEDGSRIYSITSLYDGGRGHGSAGMNLYDGETGSRDRASAAMNIDAVNLCGSGYTRLSEESRPIMNGIGEVISTRLVWEIKCDAKPAAAPQ